MEKFKKVIKVLYNALMTLILILGIVFIFLYIIGIEPFVVETGSMKPTIQPGSVSFINKRVDYDKIKEYDVIAFTASTGARVTHRVVKVTDEGFETKGDANENSDGVSTTRNNYIGKNVFSIPKAGVVVKFIQTTKGKIVIVTLIIVILLSGFLMGDNSKGKRYKEET